MTLLLLSLAGGLGAVTRFLVDSAISRRTTAWPLPVGTILINVSGSGLLGLLVGLALQHPGIQPAIPAIAGTGFCGGFTTFSTASVEVVRLWLADGPTRAAIHLVLGLGGSLVAAAGGLWVATLL